MALVRNDWTRGCRAPLWRCGDLGRFALAFALVIVPALGHAADTAKAPGGAGPVGAGPVGAGPAGPATGPTDKAAEARDVILLLDNGPLHVRLHVSVGRQAPSEARRGMIDRLLKSLDANADGKLTLDEAQRSPLFREKQRPGARELVNASSLQLSPRDISQRIERFGGETVVYRQNTSASDSDNEVFKLLDADSDETLSELEMTDAIDTLLARDSDDDECVTLDEFAPTPVADPSLVVTPTPQPRVPTTSVADIIRDTRQTLLAAQLIKKYDKNRDSQLSPEELFWPAERIAPCDADKNGRLSVKELGQLHKADPDINLAVDVIRTAGEPMLRVLSTHGEGVEDERVPDLATVRLSSAVVTFSTREVDPFETSMTIALRTFNELDTDTNGYLDKDETMLRERFARGLFDQIDADADGKIFGEEMKEFIRSRGEPVATTCQVTAFDDGAGFFSALDVNGDRRISMREMRYAQKTLTTMQRDDQPGLSVTEPARRYRIEFVRGVFNPFGNADRPANPQQMPQPPATARPRPVGPIWFQRWDRNNDGDITWREFFGPRDAFEQLDADSDDLIDPKEAEVAVSLSTPRESRSPDTEEKTADQRP